MNVLIRTSNERRIKTQKEEAYLNMAADTGATLPQTKEHQEPPEAGRGREGSFLDPAQGAWPANVLTANIKPLEQ